MSRRGENYFFFVALLAILVFGAFTMVKNVGIDSAFENRKLNQFPHLTITGFLDGSFQKSFESAFSDQFFTSGEIRINYKQAMAGLPKFGLDKMVCENNYLELLNSTTERRATFNCEDYIVYFPKNLSEKQKEIFSQNIEKYNYLNSVSDTYYYFVNNPTKMNFKTNEKATDYVGILNENLKGKYHFASFDFKNYEDYKKYFYKTDHHWNYKGSYLGYLDIAKMLGFSKTVKPKNTFSIPEPFFGSHSRAIQNYDYYDDFSMYDFDIPEHEVEVNGVVGSYGHKEECKNHSYDGKMIYFYAFCYGKDFGEVVYDFKQPKKENLLIIANSYSNPINELIAMNYNKTFVIDLRYYKSALGHDFDLENFIKKYGIKKTLVIFSPGFVLEDGNNEGLEP